MGVLSKINSGNLLTGSDFLNNTIIISANFSVCCDNVILVCFE